MNTTPHVAMPNNPGQAWAAEDLWLQLEPLLPGLSVEVVAECGSTNTVLLERARSAAHGGGGDASPCLLVAESQTQGRGRMGRAWASAPGSSLTFTLALPLAPASWDGLSLAVGLALADALEPLTDAHTRPRLGLKWPNDLWLWDGPAQGRKLGGILVETVATGSPGNAGPSQVSLTPLGGGLDTVQPWGHAGRLVLVGVGLNVRAQQDLPVGLSNGYGCVQELWAAGPTPTPSQVLHRVAEPLLRGLQCFERTGFAPLRDAYTRRDVLRGQPIETTAAVPGAGLAAGVEENGALCVRDGAGALHRVVSGEVSVRFGAATQKGAA